MADYAFNVKSVGSLTVATTPQVDNGDVLIIEGENAFRAPASVMKGKQGDPGKSAYQVWLEMGNFGSEINFFDSFKGYNGLSAYEVALQNGFIGTETEWLESLQGKGLDYTTMTPQEIANITGKSAYDEAVDDGFVGTVTEWLESLKGGKGDPGKSSYQVWLDEGNTGSPQDYFDSLRGAVGPQGKPLIVLPNGNYGNWNETLQDYVDTGIKASATVDIDNVNVTFTEASSRENITSGESVPTLFGKIRKWFSDFGALAFKSLVAVSDMDSGVQTSLSKADSALQSFTETDPTVPSWAKSLTKPTYTPSEIGAATAAQGTKADSALQAITKALVEAVLSGDISTHTHGIYALASALAGYSPASHTHNYQPLEAGKGLSTNDFDATAKAKSDFEGSDGSQSSLNNMAITKHITHVSASSNQSFSIASVACVDKDFVIAFTATAALTIAMPSTNSEYNSYFIEASYTLSAGEEIEINVFKSSVTGKYHLMVRE